MWFLYCTYDTFQSHWKLQRARFRGISTADADGNHSWVASSIWAVNTYPDTVCTTQTICSKFQSSNFYSSRWSSWLIWTRKPEVVGFRYGCIQGFPQCPLICPFLFSEPSSVLQSSQQSHDTSLVMKAERSDGYRKLQEKSYSETFV